MPKIFSFFYLLLFITPIYSQQWHRIEATYQPPLRSLEKRAVPLSSLTFQTNYELVRSKIDTYNFRGEKSIMLPNTEGVLIRYWIKEDRMMEAEIASRYPDIKVYEGFDESGQRRVRLDFGAYGLNAIITSEQGMEFVSPIYTSSKDFYHVYSLNNAPLKDMNTYCGTIGQNPNEIRHTPSSLGALRNTNYQKLEYKFALACTGEGG
ncbi:MAG TPA: hypothetical protein PKD85_21740, partial [Saprospiraceae bacterium]|nr:hypothetical protein [Saprospiraceae bacterium]